MAAYFSSISLVFSSECIWIYHVIGWYTEHERIRFLVGSLAYGGIKKRVPEASYISPALSNCSLFRTVSHTSIKRHEKLVNGIPRRTDSHWALLPFRPVLLSQWCRFGLCPIIASSATRHWLNRCGVYCRLWESACSFDLAATLTDFHLGLCRLFTLVFVVSNCVP